MTGRWHPLRVPGDQPEQELTQRNDFLDDDEALLSTVAREFIQNALDAAGKGGRVTVRFRAVDEPEDRAVFRSLLSGLEKHADACGLDWDPESRPAALVMEDFGTTGLCGGTCRKEAEGHQWSDFWWRFGRSGKTGDKQGRNGLGRISYALLSAIGAFWVCTLRQGEADPLLMGLALLNTREVNGERYQPLMYWGRKESRCPLVLPVRDRNAVMEFARIFGIERTSPGVSVVIPLPGIRAEDWEDSLRVAITRNQFFPILRGRLEVTVSGVALAPDDLSRHAGGEEEKEFLEFLREAVLLLGDSPDYLLLSGWQSDPDRLGLGEDNLRRLRTEFQQRKTICFRVPFTFRERRPGAKIRRGRARHEDVVERSGHILVFLKSSVRPGRDLFVRDDLAIIKEHHLTKGRRVLALTVAERNPLASLLGDAEDPAHMRWRLNTERLRRCHVGAQEVIRNVRTIAARLADLLAGHREERFHDVLDRFFPRKEPVGRGNESTEPGGGAEPGSECPLRIERSGMGKDGNVVKVTFKRIAGLAGSLKLRVRLGYETVDGSVARKKVDFEKIMCEVKRVVDQDGRKPKVSRAADGDFVADLPETLQEIRLVLKGLDPNRTARIEAMLE